MDLDKLKFLIEPSLVDSGLKIHDLNYEKENNNNFLRIIIDKDGIVDIDDCVKATNIINTVLDNLDIIKETYILDVSSKERGRKNG